MSALPGSDAAVFAFGPFVLDRDRRLLARDGAPVDVTPKAFDLLVILVERGGAVVTKDQLMDALWPDTTVEESNLAFQVSTLRKALGPEGARFIATLPGRGYQFVAPLQRLEMTSTEAIVEQEDRTTITVTETHRGWPWVAALALVVLGAIAAIVLLRRDRVPASPPIASVAVLPFKPLAAAQRDEALELGMADTLITRLSRIPSMVVRPVSAVRGYTKLEDDPLAAGKKLGVDAVVDGTIQRRGPRMRVTVRLLRISDGKPVWATQLDESADDLFAVQDLVAERVAGALTEGAPQPARRITADLRAYELYVRGRYWLQENPVGAEQLFRQAITRDPRFAAAWAGVAESWLLRARFSNRPPSETFEKAREPAMKAVGLDPELADGHVALAQVYSDLDWNWDAADREYRRALELNPNSDVAHQQFSQLLLVRRRFDEALEHSRRAVEIDPLSPSCAMSLGIVLENAGRNEEAIAHWQKTLHAHPGLIPALLHLGLTYLNAGKPEEAIAAIDRATAVRGASSQLDAVKAAALAKAGRREEALELVRKLEKFGERRPPPSHTLALAWTLLGDHDRAFSWIERAYRDRLYFIRWVAVGPGFEPLREDPRYGDLMRRMGL